MPLPNFISAMNLMFKLYQLMLVLAPTIGATASIFGASTAGSGAKGVAGHSLGSFSSASLWSTSGMLGVVTAARPIPRSCAWLLTSAECNAAGDFSPPVRRIRGRGGEVGVRGREVSVEMALDEICVKKACRAETGFADFDSSSSLVSRKSEEV